MRTHKEWQKRVITRLLQQDTGRHFLDSGSAYGRHWQRNQVKTTDELIGNEVDLTIMSTYFELSRPVGRWLLEGWSFDREHTNRLWEVSHRSDRKDMTWTEDLESYIEHRNGEIRWNSGINTCNDSNLLTQSVHFVPIDLPDRCGEYYALRVHQGCDLRGGYGQWVIAEMSDEAYNYANANLGCNNGHHWYTDDAGHHWYNGESYRTFTDKYFKIRSNKNASWLACPECNCKLEAY
jgi:hypothetical protein